MPLRLRLALWYGSLTGALILLVCGYAYGVHSRSHYDWLDEVLGTVTEHLVQEVQAARRRPEEIGALRASSVLRAGIRIYRADGALEFQSRIAATAPSFDPGALLRRGSVAAYPHTTALAPPMLAAYHGSGAYGVVEGPAGTGRWRVCVRPITGGTQYLAALMPLEHIDRSVRRFAQLMVGITLVGVTVAFLLIWLIAGRALRPVAVVTATAHEIARSREFRRRVPDGLSHPDGQATGSRDELRRLATTFNEMLESLEEAYGAQQRFVADASHELRAPLTAIQANLELLRTRPELDAEQRAQAVAEAHDETERLARLVADLLVLARADAGAMLRHDPVELDAVLMEVLGEAKHLARGQRLGIDGLQPAVVRGDRDRLKQLLLILVDNALKYTPASGRVSLGLTRDNAHAHVTVSDTGIGIPPEALPRVFERFFRADPARTRDPGGTGLGLSIARWIANQHSAQLSIDSAPGRGTVVLVRFPADA